MRVLRPLLALLLAASAPMSAAAQVPAQSVKRKKAADPAAAAPASAAAPGDPPGSPLSSSGSRVSLPSFSGPSSPTALGGMPPPPLCGPAERQELDKLTSLNMIEQQKVMTKLRPLSEERDQTSAQYNALYEKQKLELLPVEFELKKLQLQGNLEEEKFKKELSALRQERDRARMANEIAREKYQSAQLKLDVEKLGAEAEKLKMDVATRDMDFQSRKLRMETELAEHKTVALKSDLDLRGKKDEWKKQANRDPEYPPEPFKGGVLTVSDRRIVMDGPIVSGMADYVTERIHYWNNKDESLPIFIIIDRSPGGSVMEGYRIVKAISASKAPVHVVVKSFAASMAAVITTLAPRSYAYPNAVILHHQMSGVLWGNMTVQKEQLEINQEWFRRLAVPVARKMGTDLDGLVKQMYKHNSEGDWEEFGDKAVALKWVDHVVHEIRETGIVKEPEDKKEEKPKLLFGMAEETDAHGERFVRLPRLQPMDAYWVYNPDNYYR